MIRRLLKLLTAASPLLCVATCGLWVRSLRAKSSVEFSRKGVVWEAASDHGWLRLSNEPQRQAEARNWKARGDALFYAISRVGNDLDSAAYMLSHPVPGETQTNTPNLAELDARLKRTYSARMAHQRTPQCTTPLVAYSVPHAAPAIAGVVLPLMWLTSRLRRRRRMARDLCPVCGYDLRATPERCPECGTMAARS